MKSVVLTHASGLHARPASLIAKAAQAFKAEIEIIKDKSVYNGKSLMALMSMGAVSGDTLEIRCSGEDAENAEEMIISVIDRINAE